MAKLISQVKSFTTRAGKSNVQHLALVLSCMDHFTQHNDWTPLAWLLAMTEGQGQTRSRGIVRQCYAGLKLVRSKEQPSGYAFKVSENAGPTDMMEKLRKLVAGHASILSKDVSSIFFVSTPTEYDIDKAVKALSKKLMTEKIAFSVFNGKLKAAMSELTVTQGKEKDKAIVA